MMRRCSSSTITTATAHAMKIVGRTAVTVNHLGERIYSPIQSRPSILPQANKFTTLHEWYLSRIDKFPDRIGAVCGVTGREVSYAAMAHRCEHLSSELYHTFNVRAGDTVALVSPNSVDYNSAFHAVLKLGARVTTANPLYSAEELRLQLDLAGAKVIYTISAFEELARKTAALPSPSTGKVESIGVLLADRPLKVGDKPVPIPSSEQGFIKGRGDDTVVVPFSSGTTGLPKGVQLTNRNLITNLYQTDSALESRQSDVSIAVLPYFHIYGMTVVMNGMMLHGAKQIVVPKFELTPFLELIEKHKATMLIVVPPMIIGFVKHPGVHTFDLTSVRRVLSGAAPLSTEVQKMSKSVFKNSIAIQAYGLSETSPVATMALPGQQGAGALIADCEMRIIRVGEQEGGGEATEGIDVAEGEEGEIWFRGPNIMKGYLKQEDTDKVMAKGGWFRTETSARSMCPTST